MDDEKKCPECGNTLEETVKTGRNGRPIWFWRCDCCGCEFDDDGNMISSDEDMDDNDFALADFCHGGDLSDD